MIRKKKPWYYPGIWIAPNRPYRLEQPTDVEPAGRYTLAFIEFDDQGWYHSLDQRKSLSNLLDSYVDNDLIVLVFLHGWKHNAAQDDENVQQFREILESAHRSEQARGGLRHILGVYIGWRGLSARGNPFWEDLSFYSRRNAALRVAVGSVRDTLALLKTYRDKRRRRAADRSADCSQEVRPDTDGTRLIVAGHSFGGLILFSALSEYFIESTYSDDIISPFGDLVILANPAFEATRYQPLATALFEHPGFARGQRPVFIAFTATNDKATKIAFRIGRRLETLFESTLPNALVPPLRRNAQKQANINTIGHLPWLTTHVLTASPDHEPQPQGFRRSAAAAFHEEAEAFRAFNSTYRSDGCLKPFWRRCYTSGAHLEHVAGDPNNPFWVVETSPDVIDGHNGIFKPIFIDFLGQLIDDRLRPL